ncbi:MAG: hypothetical protein KGI55_06080, partial [Gammaproteobacteria bacterium]|nr:hypothetical protein [Gammaproteobacteria bacterium]
MRSSIPRFRSVLALCAATALGFSVSLGYATGAYAASTPPVPTAVGTEGELPDLGSPANAAISLEDEYEAGLMYTREMRQRGVILGDPEVSEYIEDIGHQLSSYAEEGQHAFSYFVIKDPDINAFAIPGG